MHSRKIILGFVACIGMALAAAVPADAACTSPDGAEGTLRYDSGTREFLYCDGSNWGSMGSSGVSSRPVDSLTSFADDFSDMDTYTYNGGSTGKITLVDISGQSGTLAGGQVFGYYVQTLDPRNHGVSITVDGGPTFDWPPNGVYGRARDAAGNNTSAIVLPQIHFDNSLKVEFLAQTTNVNAAAYVRPGGGGASPKTMSSGAGVVTGSYVGDGSNPREIQLGFRPKSVIIKARDSTYNFQMIALDGVPDGSTSLYSYHTKNSGNSSRIDITDKGFKFVGSTTDSSTANHAGTNYHYVAIGSTGGGGFAASMVDGWPDAISCNPNSASPDRYSVFYLLNANDGGAKYGHSGGGQDNEITFADKISPGVLANGNFGWDTAGDCASPISEIYAKGLAFNFVGSQQSKKRGAIDTAMAGNLPQAPNQEDWADAIICDVGNGRLDVFQLELKYDDADNKMLYRRHSSHYVYYKVSNGDKESSGGVGSDCPANYASIKDSWKIYYGGGGSDQGGYRTVCGRKSGTSLPATDYTGSGGSSTHCRADWTASDCSNGLPNSSCVGYISKSTHSGADDDWSAMVPGETSLSGHTFSSGGMDWYNGSGCTGRLGWIEVVYECY